MLAVSIDSSEQSWLICPREADGNMSLAGRSEPAEKAAAENNKYQ